MRLGYLESLKGWEGNIQIAPDYANHPSPYTDSKGNVYTCGFTQGVASAIVEDSATSCTSFWLKQKAAGCALFTVPVISNNGGIFSSDSDHKILPAIRKLAYGGSFFIKSENGLGAIELDCSIFMDGVYYAFAHQLRINQTNPKSKLLYEWDVTDNNGVWIPTGLRGYPKLNEWNNFALFVEKYQGDIMAYDTILLNDDTQSVMRAWPAAHVDSQKGWWGMQPNVQLDGMASSAEQTIEMKVRDLTIQF